MSQAEETILGNLTEVMASICDVLACAIVVSGDSAPTHRVGDAASTAALPDLPAVADVLADGAGRLADVPEQGPLAAAGFIAVEPVAIYGEGRPRAAVVAGSRVAERDRAEGLLRALALETASEIAVAVQAPYLAAGLAEAACGITIADPHLPDLPLIYVNDAFAQMTGYDRASLLGRNCRFLQGHLRDQPQIATLRNAIRQGLDCTVTLTNIRANGEAWANRLKLRAVRAPDGALAYYVGIQLDVSAERTVLTTLRQQERRYESLIRASASYIWHLDAEGRVSEPDRAWLDLAGLSAEEAATAGRLAALAPDEAQAYEVAWRDARAAGTAFEVTYHLPAGSAAPAWLVDRVAPVRDDDGRIVEWIAITQDITQQKRMFLDLYQSRERFRRLFEDAGIAIAIVDLDGRIRDVNPALQRLLVYQRERLRGIHIYEVSYEEDVQKDLEKFDRLRNGLQESYVMEKRFVCSDGSIILGRLTVSLVRDASGAPDYALGLVEDITALERAERELSQVVESAPSGMLVVAPDGTIERANDLASELFGYPLAELVGLRVEALMPAAARTRHARLRQRYLEARERRRMGPGRELEGQRKDGTVFPVEVGLNAFGWGASQRVVASVTDITERRRAEQEVARAAYEDRLTGLLSRAGFTQALDQRLAAGDLHPASQVVVIDIQALRDINNVCGYGGGDAVLVDVGRRLRAELGETGLAARLGGDEFAVLVPIEGRQGPQGRRNRLAAIFREPFDIDGLAFYVEARFGYTRLGRRPAGSAELLRRAELALHHSQHERSRAWTQYTAALARYAGRHARLVHDLRRALGGDQLCLYYQPKLDLATGRLMGAEALLRWNHPERGLVPPGEFIPVAETSQLIGPIGDVALERACQDLAAWRAAGLATVPISVNVSAVQLKLGGFPAKVERALARHGLAPGDLVLEVTESVFRSSDGTLRADLDWLRGLGVKLSLDDFGTGYSALLQLRDEPFDEIKIDKGFVFGLTDDAYGRAIVTAVMEIAEAIGARVIAEGVETAAVEATLQRLGCSFGQGFYYDRPLPEPDWRDRLIRMI